MIQGFIAHEFKKRSPSVYQYQFDFTSVQKTVSTKLRALNEDTETQST